MMNRRMLFGLVTAIPMLAAGATVAVVKKLKPYTGPEPKFSGEGFWSRTWQSTNVMEKLEDPKWTAGLARTSAGYLRDISRNGAITDFKWWDHVGPFEITDGLKSSASGRSDILQIIAVVLERCADHIDHAYENKVA